MIYKKALVCTDFNEKNDQLLLRAIERTKKEGTTIHLCHVIKPVAAISINYYYYPLSIDMETEALKMAEEKMKESLANLKLPTEQGRVFFGDPKSDIIREAEKLSADVIILAGTSHSTLGMLGSVADYVINNAKCDVLVLRG